MPRQNRPIPPDPDEQNNARSEWADEAIRAFAEQVGYHEPETLLQDLLCDLRHWCDRNNISFGRVLERSGRMYKTETRVLEDVPTTQPPPMTEGQINQIDPPF